MTVRLAVAASLALLTSVASPADAARPGEILATSNDVNPAGGLGTGTLFELDGATGAGTTVASLAYPGTSLTFNSFDGQLYATRPTGSGNSELVVMDPATGADVAVIGQPLDGSGTRYGFTGAGFDSDGTMFAVSAGTDELITVDTDTALVTVVGPLGFNALSLGATILDDVLYLVSGQRPNNNFPSGVETTLYTVDLDTGAATVVGGTGLFKASVGVAVDGAGRLLTVLDDSLYELDPATGAATLIGASGVDPATTFISGLEFLDTVASECPCDVDASGAAWKNHGTYMACVRGSAGAQRSAGAISGAEYGAIVSDAAQSDCGK